MSQQVSGAGAVRPEDAFDVGAVAGWLRDHADNPTGLDGTPTVTQFSGGASNLTYLLAYPSRELILRRAPRGTKARGAHDMRREFRIQSSLAPILPYIAPMIAFCDDDAVLGADFYVMGRLDGVIPGAQWPSEVPLDAQQARQLCLNFVDVLVELHSVDPEEAGLADLGKGFGYVRRQVDGWSARFRNAHTPDVPDYENVMDWLDANQPDDVANCVIHNDFKLDNVVLDEADPTRVIGILDWEMATLGDPLMDVGNTLAYWVQADDDALFQQVRRQPTHLPGMLTRQEVIDYYGSKTGYRVDNFDFYALYGLFRLAVIVQQIYYRYFHGQTKNPAFAGFGHISRYLEKRCQRLTAASKR